MPGLSPLGGADRNRFGAWTALGAGTAGRASPRQNWLWPVPHRRWGVWAPILLCVASCGDHRLSEL